MAQAKLIESIPFLGRKARRERKRLAELIEKLRTPHHLHLDPYVDGAGEIVAPALHAPVYTFGSSIRPARPLYDAHDLDLARQIMALGAA